MQRILIIKFLSLTGQVWIGPSDKQLNTVTTVPRVGLYLGFPVAAAGVWNALQQPITIAPVDSRRAWRRRPTPRGDLFRRFLWLHQGYQHGHEILGNGVFLSLPSLTFLPFIFPLPQNAAPQIQVVNPGKCCKQSPGRSINSINLFSQLYNNISRVFLFLTIRKLTPARALCIVNTLPPLPLCLHGVKQFEM